MGWNATGQPGDNTATDRHTPVAVTGLASGAGGSAAGPYHSLAAKSDGTVWAWGWNGGGNLGNNTTTDSRTPVRSSTVTGAFAVAAGLAHSFAVR